jgi:hypothetical protein
MNGWPRSACAWNAARSSVSKRGTADSGGSLRDASRMASRMAAIDATPRTRALWSSRADGWGGTGWEINGSFSSVGVP